MNRFCSYKNSKLRNKKNTEFIYSKVKPYCGYSFSIQLCCKRCHGFKIYLSETRCSVSFSICILLEFNWHFILSACLSKTTTGKTDTDRSIFLGRQMLALSRNVIDFTESTWLSSPQSGLTNTRCRPQLSHTGRVMV